LAALIGNSQHSQLASIARPSLASAFVGWGWQKAGQIIFSFRRKGSFTA